MAPHRRGASSTTAKRQQQQQPTQSTQPGIQRFFNKNALSSSSAPSALAAEPASQSLTPPQGTNIKPPLAADNQRQDKRFRISPGMLIQQSQDDGGGDQVVWRMSPTADRLQEASAVDNAPHHARSNVPILNENVCNLPNVHGILIRVSAGGGSVPSMTCPNKKKSPGLAGKLERWLSTSETTPIVKQGDHCGALKIISKDVAMQSQEASDWHHQTPASRDKENDVVAAISLGLGLDSNPQKASQGRGHSVLSSSRRHSLVVKSQRKRTAKQRGTGQRRKALLELLDQVQNVISDPESVSSHADYFKKGHATKPFSACNQKKPRKESRMAEAESGPGIVLATSLENAAKDSRPPWSQENMSERELCTTEDLRQGALSVSEADPNNAVNSRNGVEALLQHFESDQKMLAYSPASIPKALASIHFLVLEVADIVDKSSQSICPKKVLRLLNEYSGAERVLYLVDEWFFTVVRPGDTVNVIGDFDLDGKCSIDRKNNLLIVHPDVLISGSKVGTSFSCSRRAVLDERIRSSSVAFPALLGTMMHELFQVGLISKATTKLVLEQEAEVLVHRYIDSLFACGANERDTLDKLRDCIPTIMNWLDCFLHASPHALPKVDFGRKDGKLSVSVSEVIDIEEMIYSPKFGLKGMIDASLLVKFSSMNLGGKDRILPLEFKTGKLTTGQAALEHRAQVILYALLMSDRYLDSVDSGLLYYLQTNQTQGVAIQHADLVGLVMRRNEHAANLLLASSTQQLPPMLQNMHACQRCWHLDTCSIYHKAQEGGTAESSGLGELFNEKTEHLSGSHFGFLKQWDCLIDLEAQELQASQREIWRLPAQEREQVGSCLSSMRIKIWPDGFCEEQKKRGALVYSFSRNISYTSSNKKERKSVELNGLHERSFSCGDHVLLSTECGHVAVAAGSICDITEHSVSIKLSHQLRLPQEEGISDKELLLKQVWRIDKDETASFLAAMRFNVLQLLLKSGHEQGRRLIVDLEPPRFDSGGFFSQDPAAFYVRSAPDLNDDQRRAIFKILSARDYALVLGMPGTGKTSTIVHAVKALITRGASILLTSYTNSAVDNILLKLKQQGIDFVRLGRENAIHPDLKDHVIEGLGLSTVQELELRMSEVHVVAATCLGVTHPLLTNRKFDVCIVDEAGQITLPVCLGPLRFADSFVLVGDHYQLPPLVRNAEAREKGLAVSLFRRLSEAHPQAIAVLQCQYRMCAGIMRLCNALIYGDRLRCGSPEVANAQLEFMDNVTHRGPFWLQKAIDAANSVVFLNTDMLIAHEVRTGSSLQNTTEASIVIMVIKRLLEVGVDAKDIGVISPYNYQVQHIRRLLGPDGLAALEVHTIDRFQGRDKDCVLVSFVKSTCRGKSSSTLLADWHRINVAITRAKKKLILIGSQRTLSATPVLKFLINQVDQGGGLTNIPQDAKLLLGGNN